MMFSACFKAITPKLHGHLAPWTVQPVHIREEGRPKPVILGPNDRAATMSRPGRIDKCSLDSNITKKKFGGAFDGHTAQL